MMSERPRWLTEAARSGAAVDEAPEARAGGGAGGRGVRPGRRLGRLRRRAARRAADAPRARFERRAATVRRRPRVLLAVGAGVIVLLAALVWLVAFSSVLAARTVTVTGLADPAEQQAVVAAAA